MSIPLKSRNLFNFSARSKRRFFLNQSFLGIIIVVVVVIIVIIIIIIVIIIIITTFI